MLKWAEWRWGAGVRVWDPMVCRAGWHFFHNFIVKSWYTRISNAWKHIYYFINTDQDLLHRTTKSPIKSQFIKHKLFSSINKKYFKKTLNCYHTISTKKTLFCQSFKQSHFLSKLNHLLRKRTVS